MILAIDIGTNLGFAIKIAKQNMGNLKIPKDSMYVGLDSLPVIVGVKKLKRKSDTVRTQQLYYFIKELNEAETIDTIVYEKVYRHTGSHAGHLFGAYENVLVRCSREFSTNLVDFSPTHIKKKFSGHGHASKMRMMHEFKERTGRQADNSDCVDAYAVLKTFENSDRT